MAADNAGMRRVLLLTMLWLTACGSETPDPKDPEVPPAPSSELALPVTAPMAVRQRLLGDLKAQNEAARERGANLDTIIDTSR